MKILSIPFLRRGKVVVELSDRKDIAIALYARFPTEMAYGNHVIQIAKAFSKNNCNVNIYYPKTYNSKTLKETPEEYYGQIRNVNYVMIDNRDLTSYKIYNLLPSIFKKLLFSLSTFMWAKKLKNNQGETIIWSTNPNILYIAQKFFDKIIYEKHGEAKYIQKFSISKIKKIKMPCWWVLHKNLLMNFLVLSINLCICLMVLMKVF